VCLFFFFIPSPVQTCDIPLGEVSFTALQCGLNKFMTCYFSFWQCPSSFQYCRAAWLVIL